jgi:hypothetical protein
MCVGTRHCPLVRVLCKVDVVGTPTFEWCMIGCEWKNIDQKDLGWREIVPHAQNGSTILDAHIIQHSWGTYKII